MLDEGSESYLRLRATRSDAGLAHIVQTPVLRVRGCAAMPECALELLGILAGGRSAAHAVDGIKNARGPALSGTECRRRLLTSKLVHLLRRCAASGRNEQHQQNNMQDRYPRSTLLMSLYGALSSPAPRDVTFLYEVTPSGPQGGRGEDPLAWGRVGTLEM